MILLLFIILVIVLILVFTRLKIRIKWETIFKKHIQAEDNRFGVYCFHAKQGQGKTYCCIKFLLENNKKYPIVSNVHLKTVDYIYMSSFSEILEYTKTGGFIILYDEIFSKYNKNSRADKETINFLSQMRKRGNILLTTAQDWLELPMWLRRKVKIDIHCKKYNILKWTLYVEQYGDADNMKWDENENDYVSPRLKTSLQLMTKKTAEEYDTYETIETQ